MREGKNREVRNVLGHLGLSVNRLIRVSFGPFQLGDLAEGAVEEVPTRVLRDQLGARVVALAGADFAGPVNAVETPHRHAAAVRTPLPAARKGSRGEGNRRHGRSIEREADAAAEASPRKPKPFKPRSGHSWRGREPLDERKKPLTRKYRGQRRDGGREAVEAPANKRAGLVQDRKGRRILVERFADAKREPQDATARPQRGHRPPKRGRRPPDRASGPRPSRPRGR
jgi:23S rRNA pseudouridine2605 synthase